MFLRLSRLAPDLATLDALAEPWQKLYAHSTVVATLVLFGHVAGLLVAGALAYAAESGALRLDPDDEASRRSFVAVVPASRRAFAAALGVTMLFGVLLFFTDVEVFAVSPIFWTKMGLLALLIANLAAAARLDARLRTSPGPGAPEHVISVALCRRRRASARLSAALWLALVLSGSALASH